MGIVTMGIAIVSNIVVSKRYAISIVAEHCGQDYVAMNSAAVSNTVTWLRQGIMAMGIVDIILFRVQPDCHKFLSGKEL